MSGKLNNYKNNLRFFSNKNYAFKQKPILAPNKSPLLTYQNYSHIALLALIRVNTCKLMDTSNLGLLTSVDLL